MDIQEFKKIENQNKILSMAEKQTELYVILNELTSSIAKLSQWIASVENQSVLSSSIQPSDILLTVANYYRVGIDELKGSSRGKSIVRIRQLTMLLCRQLTKASLSEIADMLHRDHTTVAYAVSSLPHYMRSEHDLRSDYEKLYQYFSEKMNDDMVN